MYMRPETPGIIPRQRLCPWVVILSITVREMATITSAEKGSVALNGVRAPWGIAISDAYEYTRGTTSTVECKRASNRTFSQFCECDTVAPSSRLTCAMIDMQRLLTCIAFLVVGIFVRFHVDGPKDY